MLVMSRQCNQSVMIGDEIEITITEVRGLKVRVGITAPLYIPIHRREIYDAIQREKVNHKGTFYNASNKNSSSQNVISVPFLVMGREISESIVIGDEIEVTILDVRDEDVRLGFSIPKHIPVHRREIYDAIQRESETASDTQIETSYELSFRLKDDKGSIEPVLLGSDGSIVKADGTMKLLSGLYLRARLDLADTLAELEDLINNPKTKEDDIQKLFEDHPELLKMDTRDMLIPQARIARVDGADWRMDFFLKPFDEIEFCRILELKLPTLKLKPRCRSGHTHFYAELLSAIHQLKDYGRSFQSETTREAFCHHYNVNAGQPELHLIAGRRVDSGSIPEIHRLQMEENVRIIDYDTLLNRLKRRHNLQ